MWEKNVFVITFLLNITGSDRAMWSFHFPVEEKACISPEWGWGTTMTLSLGAKGSITWEGMKAMRAPRLMALRRCGIKLSFALVASSAWSSGDSSSLLTLCSKMSAWLSGSFRTNLKTNNAQDMWYWKDYVESNLGDLSKNNTVTMFPYIKISKVTIITCHGSCMH